MRPYAHLGRNSLIASAYTRERERRKILRHRDWRQQHVSSARRGAIAYRLTGRAGSSTRGIRNQNFCLETRCTWSIRHTTHVNVTRWGWNAFWRKNIFTSVRFSECGKQIKTRERVTCRCRCAHAVRKIMICCGRICIIYKTSRLRSTAVICWNHRHFLVITCMRCCRSVWYTRAVDV